MSDCSEFGALGSAGDEALESVRGGSTVFCMAPSPLANFGTLLSTVHLVGDGRRVRLRLARPGDPLSNARSFYDPRERLVVVAVEMLGGREQIVGVADIVLSERTLDEGVRELLDEAARRPRAA